MLKIKNNVGGKSDWQYAWKKSKISTSNQITSKDYNITVTISPGSETSVKAYITYPSGVSANDLTYKNFIGLTLTSKNYTVVFKNDGVAEITASSESITVSDFWSFSKGELTINTDNVFTQAMIKTLYNNNEKLSGTLKFTKKTTTTTYSAGDFISFIVSDNSSDYPSDGRYNNYWYKSIAQ